MSRHAKHKHAMSSALWAERLGPKRVCLTRRCITLFQIAPAHAFTHLPLATVQAAASSFPLTAFPLTDEHVAQ
jgi:hypothetical protein